MIFFIERHVFLFRSENSDLRRLRVSWKGNKSFTEKRDRSQIKPIPGEESETLKNGVDNILEGIKDVEQEKFLKEVLSVTRYPTVTRFRLII